jgi:stearoyl-CoA desaturase (Delta-9 desaturase)
MTTTFVRNRFDAAANVAAIFGVHALCLLAFWTGVNAASVALCAGLFLVRKFGITAGYHRYFSHTSYKTSRFFQFVLAFLGAMAAQRGPLWWAAHHRNHHRYSDTEADIHSPIRRGLWWSHIGWILSPVYEKADRRLVPDFAKYPELRWLDDNFLAPPLILGLLCFLFGGLRGLVWGMFISTTILWHTTFLINSATHLIGQKRFPTKDESRNHWFLALLTLGEGWHNNHHYYPTSVNQGFYWWEIDISYYILRILSVFGIVWDLRRPPARVLALGRQLRSAWAVKGVIIAMALTGSASLLWAQARRPPLPQEPVSAVAAGRAVKGVIAVQVEGAPCLSLRDVQRLVGGRLLWRRMAREVSHEREGRHILYTLDVSSAVVDGKTVSLAVPVRWWTGQAYVPISFLQTPDFQSFAEAQVAWAAEAGALAVIPIPDISSPRFTSKPGRTRVVFDVGPRVDYRVLAERDGELWLRFFGGKAASRERLQVTDPLITSVDILPRSNACDIVITLSETAGRPLVTLEESPRRLVVEAFSSGSAPPVAEGDGAVPPAGEGPAAEALSPVPAVEILPQGDISKEDVRPNPKDILPVLSPVRVIVIDPGHGGKDAGAVGRRGNLEKEINLSMALRLADALRATKRYEVHLTREDDRFVSLQDRAVFANDKKADLFISVHCNAGLSPKAEGFEVYFLSERASDDSAAAVARRENASLELEGAASQAKAKLSQLLWSLAKTETLNESSEMAALVNKHAGKEKLDAASRGVKQAGFYVLKWAEMPAILVECAFITNPREEKLLRSHRYAQKLVDAVAAAVHEYEERKVQARLGAKKDGGT